MTIETVLSEQPRLPNGGQHPHDSQLAYCSAEPADAIDVCIHELIESHCNEDPEAPAVCAWDGDFTYRQLQARATAFGRYLATKGVGPEVTVAIYLHKSRWTVVAILGVLHSGGAFVLLDPAHPAQRLELMCKTVSATLVITSPQNLEEAKALGPEVMVMGETFKRIAGEEASGDDESAIRRAAAIPSNAAYVAFTSGTTGKPKGVVIEHRSISTSSVAFGAAIMLTRSSRMFQFASHAFDACLMEILAPLAYGACVCIPSEDERRNDLAGAVRRFAINMAIFTPSVARTLNPVALPTLRTVVCAGEAMSEQDIRQWTPHVNLINAYGPSECAVAACATPPLDITATALPTAIGRAIGGSCWVVDEDDIEVLTPVGHIGELLIEGPIVGRGYIRDAESTAASFVGRPQWLRALWPNSTGQVYRTGDLARCHEDGSIECLGRKDSQLKLHGQRMEAAEIEQHIRQILLAGDLAVELIHPRDDPDSPQLAAFVVPEESRYSMALESQLTVASDGFQMRVEDMKKSLHQKLPNYMVPSVFLTLSQMPLSATGKLDRRALRLLANSRTRRQLQDPGLQESVVVETIAPRNDSQETLRTLWAEVLQIPAQQIGLGDSFWNLGGSSIRAMKLAGLALTRGFKLEMHCIWAPDSTLEAMAAKLRNHCSSVQKNVSSFALCGNESQREQLIQTLDEYGIERPEIEDLYPCTPLQQGLFSETAKRFGAYTLSEEFTLPRDVDLDRFRRSWERAVEANPILRTRIISYNSTGLWQAVIRDRIPWEARDAGQDIPLEWKDWKLGQRLIRLALSRPLAAQAPVLFTLVIHHALIDGWGLPLILHQVNQAYNGRALETEPFAPFVQYLISQDQEAMVHHWRQRLSQFGASIIPKPPSPQYIPVPSASMSCTVHLAGSPKAGGQATVPSQVILAWSLLIAQYTNNWDVLFGLTVAGRGARVPGIGKMTGPTIASIPMRLLLDRQTTVAATLGSIQAQLAEDASFEQVGIQRLRHSVPEYATASPFHSHLVIQPDVSEYPRPSLFADNRELTRLSDIQHKNKGILRDIQGLSPSDFRDLQQWNGHKPSTINQCAHELISASTLARPHALAICAWDGNFTYRELGIQAEHLARKLSSVGVGPATFVGLCFEKSRWTSVAMLAVLKVGGAFALLDPSHPIQRLQEMSRQLQGSVVVCSESKASVARKLGLPDVVIVGSNGVEMTDSRTTTSTKESCLPHLSPSSAMYVVFTSGSTGSPKGVVMTHAAWCTAAGVYASKLRLDEHSRVLQFSAYAFDVSVTDSLLPLVAGGCVCIPSEADRISNLAGAIAALRANWAMITPSIARILSPQAAPTLQILVLVGEPMNASDVEQWLPHVQLMNGYGPAECAVLVSLQPAVGKGSAPITGIGAVAGAVGWVVDPEDPTRLSPIGTVGELLVEGPTIAQGYLNEPQKSAENFIQCPPWLRAFRDTPSSTLYKTGDLVQYTNDGGELMLVGRKDTQVKLRGQRVEIAEVEHHLERCFPDSHGVAAELIKPQDGRDAFLAGFICASPAMQTNATSIFEEADDTFREAAGLALSQLENAVPAYMVPAVLIPVNWLPLSGTGKLNRRELHAQASCLRSEQLDMLRVSETAGAVRREPTSHLQRELQRAFANVLFVAQDQIGIDDHFFRRGGDSLSAMRLVALIRKAGYNLAVADVFTSPRIIDLAQKIGLLQGDEPADTPVAFSLSSGQPVDDEIRATLLEQADIGHDQIEDIYPAIPMQKGLMALSLKDPGKYVAKYVYDLAQGVDRDRFQGAFDAVFAANPILRTRFVLAHTGSFQVVVRALPQWQRYRTWHEYEDSPSSTPAMGPNVCLVYPTLIADSPGSGRFVLTIHHALYDGWSMPLLWEQINAAYRGQRLTHRPFSPFVAYLKQRWTGLDSSSSFWSAQFDELNAAVFPTLPSPDYNPTPTKTVRRHILLRPRPQTAYTMATAIQLAWAILVSYYTDCDDVVYGLTLSGRNAPVRGLDECTGPTMTTVPFRVQLDSKRSIQHHVALLQQQLVAMIPHEQTGLHRIQSISKSTARACEFQNHLVIQSPPTKVTTDKGGLVTEVKDLEDAPDFGSFASYGIVLICNLAGHQDHPLEITAQYDPNLLSNQLVERMAEQLEHLLCQIVSSDSHVALRDLSAISSSDWKQLTEWNATLPPAREQCLHDLVLERCALNPNSVALDAWDGSLSFKELASLSCGVAVLLIAEGIQQGSTVAVCLERSKSAIVTFLAVLRTGATLVCVDCNHPAPRVQEIVDQVKARVVIASAETKAKFNRCSVTILTAPFKELTSHSPNNPLPVNVDPASLAFILFTSGSTGRPKGIMMEHRQVSTGIRDQSGPLGITQASRVLHFASYAFDIFLAEIFTTLALGGTVCIPTEAGRMNALETFIAQKQANWALLTPSMLSILEPARVPTLQTIVSAGEAITRHVAQRWASRVVLINGYGPAETTVTCACGLVDIDSSEDHDDKNWAEGWIGRIHGGAGWVTVPSDPTRLAPLGAVGELIVEGPTVTRGYLNNPEATAAAFISAPGWLKRWRNGMPGRLYRTGDLVQQGHDGAIRYIGRKDTQVKLRGQRIELQEIEHHVHRAAGGAAAVVVDVAAMTGSSSPSSSSTSVLFACIASAQGASSGLRSVGGNGNRELTTVFLPPTPCFRETVALVQRSLRAQLPEYMIPLLFLPLERAPQTASGKVDRRRLREAVQALSSSQTQEYASPSPSSSSSSSPTAGRQQPATPQEAVMHQVWARVLNKAPGELGMDDSFFHVGGDSISAMQLVSQLSKIGLRTTVKAIFEEKTIANLAATVAAAATNEEPATAKGRSMAYVPFSLSRIRYNAELDTLLRSTLPDRGLLSTDVEDVYPLSPVQQGMLISQYRTGDVYNNSFLLTATAAPGGLKVDVDKLAAAWSCVVARHPMLRSCILTSNASSTGLDLQIVRRAISSGTTTTTILPPCPDPIQLLLQRTRAAVAFPAGAPPHHLTLCASPQGRRVGALLKISHLLMDGYSFRILVRDLALAYDGRLPMGAPSSSYGAYVAYLQSLDTSANQTYWKEALRDANACILPASKILASQPALGGSRERSLRSIKAVLGNQAELRRLSADNGLTLATIVYLAWGFVLRSYTSSDDVCFGYASSGRDIAELPGSLEDTVGPIVNVLVCRMRMAPGQNAYDLARQVQQDLALNAAHQHVSLADIHRSIGDADMPTLFNTAVSFASECSPSLDGRSVLLETTSSDGATEYDLNVGVVMVGQTHISITLEYWSTFQSDEQAAMILDTFEHTIHLLAANIRHESVGRLSILGPAGRKQVEAWNHNLPPLSVDSRVHELVSQRCAAQPDAAAVCSHDGDFTYGDLEAFSSALASNMVREHCVGPGMFVAICFEKSRWAVVVVLAVLKVGAAFVLLDPAHPRQRLQEICRQVEARLVVTSKAQRSTMAEDLALRTLVLGEDITPWGVSSTPPSMFKTVASAEPAYVIFTSGSTGKAKGVVISHANFCTNAATNGARIGLGPSSRALHFSSYAFDASVLEILFTLLAGGCLCIPSDAERVGDLPGAINRLQVNWACLTPSVARVLNPETIPGVRTLLLAGEAVVAGDVAKWSHLLHLHNGYGPAECAIISTAHPGLRDETDPTNIGHAYGSAAWIVDPKDPGMLTPVGAVGELVIEGPIVSTLGYLSNANSEAREAGFINPPPSWLRLLCARRGREAGRLYRTGDLVQYEPTDGSMRYIGRKDTQVKLRGQRIELGEVEFHLRHCFPGTDIHAIADVLSINGKPPALVAFIADGQDAPGCGAEDALVGVSNAYFRQRIAVAASQLKEALPVFMVPEVFIPIRRIPLSLTGKINRRALRAAAAGLPEDFLDGCTATLVQSTAQHKQPPATVAEQVFQRIFADIFTRKNITTIGREDHFFRLGGDSIQAMTLIPKAREAGYGITMADCFRNPRLCDLAQAATRLNDHEDINYEQGQQHGLNPFALVAKPDHCDLASFAAQHCVGVSAAQIQDVYPCTPLQEGLMALSIKSTATISQYVVTFAYNLDPRVVVLDRFRAAWTAAAVAHTILRTRIIQSEAHSSMLQVVVADPPAFHYFDNRAGHDAHLETQPWGLGNRLVELALVTSGRDVQFYLTLHHALYDGRMMDVLWRQVTQRYHEPSNPLLSRPFHQFIRYVQQGKEEAAAYWRGEFSNLRAPIWPALPMTGQAPSSHSNSHSSISRTVANFNVSSSEVEYTPTSLVHLAWALMMSSYTDSEDLVFGVTLNGRNAPVLGIEEMAGPTITTFPLRVRLGPGSNTVADTLSVIQDQAVARIPFEQFGLQNIRQLSTEAGQACQFQCHLLIQMAPPPPLAADMFAPIDSDQGNLAAFAESALWVVCHIGNNSAVPTATVELNYDPRVVSPTMAAKILGQFCHLLQVLPSNLTTPLCQLNCVSDDDRRQLLEWNRNVPAPINGCLHDLVLEQVRATPQAPAVSAWDGDLTYTELDQFSQEMAGRLRDLGVRPGSFVPICLPKSKWAVVTMLAVLRAGGACVLLEPSHPAEYIATIVARVKPTLIITSATTRQLIPTHSGVRIESVPFTHCQEQVAGRNGDNARWPQPSYRDTAFVVFTSGSTGQPKGILMDHSHLCTSIRNHSAAMNITSSGRVLYFASFAFDMSIYEPFSFLAHGGCVCIPSDTDRLSNLAGFIRSARVNYAMFAPSLLSRLLRPEDVVQTLKTVALVGEAVAQDVVDTWASHLTLVNGYGPAEATICAAGRIDPASWSAGVIGPATGCVGWITTPADVSRLTPVGAIGELLIEGPVVTRGYLDDAERTAAAYIKAPPWLAELRGVNPESGGENQTRLYRTGDLVQYTDAGCIKYVGRKDTQVKIRGQRVELSQVEHHVRVCFLGQAAAEVEVVAETALRDGVPILIAFVKQPIQVGKCLVGHPDGDGGSDNNALLAPPSATFHRQVQVATARLRAELPAYMVPLIFLELAQVPRTASSKVDRRRLRDHIACLPLDEFRALSLDPTKEIPPIRAMTDRERLFQDLWATVLSISPDTIGPEDDFFQLGGDSIQAMKLASRLRTRGLTLAVADIFVWRKLAQQARGARTFFRKEEYRPGSLLSMGSEILESFIARQLQSLPSSPSSLSWRPADVEDVFPVTEFQRQFLEPLQVHYVKLTLPDDIDTARLTNACRAIVRRHPILHSVFLPYKEQSSGYLQVMLRLPEDDAIQLDVVHCDPGQELVPFLHRFCIEDATKGVPWGTLFFRATLVLQSSLISSPSQRNQYSGHHSHSSPAAALILRISHAQYDGQSMPFIWRDLASAYAGDSATDSTIIESASPSFAAYLQYRQTQATAETFRFWKDYLQDSEMAPFPLSLPSPADSNPSSHSSNLGYSSHSGEDDDDDDSLTTVTSVVIRSKCIPMPSPPNGITVSTVVKAAWALVLAQDTGNRDIVFGHFLNGRDVPLAGVHGISGPCVTISPIRIRIPQGYSSSYSSPSPAASELLAHVQEQYTSTMRYANIDFDLIRQHATKWPAATTFNSLVTYQNDGNVPTHIDFAGRQCAFGMQVVGPSANCGVVAAPEKPKRRRMPRGNGPDGGAGPLEHLENEEEEEPQLLRVQLIMPRGRSTSRAMEDMLERLCGVIGVLGRGAFPYSGLP